MEPDFDIHRTLAQLDPETWQSDALDPEWYDIGGRLSVKAVRRLSPADLHWLIGHQLSLPFTVVLAMPLLSEDPFLAAGAHPGDLLTTVLEVDIRYWQAHYDHWVDMAGILAHALDQVHEKMQAAGGEYLPWFMGDELMVAAIHFRGIFHPPEQE